MLINCCTLSVFFGISAVFAFLTLQFFGFVIASLATLNCITLGYLFYFEFYLTYKAVKVNNSEGNAFPNNNDFSAF